jgi:hypothetical protein
MTFSGCCATGSFGRHPEEKRAARPTQKPWKRLCAWAFPMQLWFGPEASPLTRIRSYDQIERSLFARSPMSGLQNAMPCSYGKSRVRSKSLRIVRFNEQEGLGAAVAKGSWIKRSLSRAETDH